MLVAAKQCMEIWQRLVHIKGGKLELDNSIYAVMAWKLKEGRESFVRLLIHYGRCQSDRKGTNVWR